MTIFTDILNKGRTGMQSPGLKDSRDWFREKARAVASVNTSRLVSGNPQHQRTIVLPGNMYMFSYEAKYKETLPFYDRFPLVFPFHVESDSFTGINLHYLPHILRAKLMDALYDLATNVRFDEKTKLRLSYTVLNSSSRYKYFEPCVKKYLFTHTKSRFLMVPSNEWDIALFLPLERFTVNKSIVYKNTLEQIGR